MAKLVLFLKAIKLWGWMRVLSLPLFLFWYWSLTNDAYVSIINTTVGSAFPSCLYLSFQIPFFYSCQHEASYHFGYGAFGVVA